MCITKSETTLPFKAELGPENGFIIGGSRDDVAVENGLKFHIDWLKGQKTGFFVDQRDNRSLLERYARGRAVLNMFCYTGGFSVYAMRGGATLVHSVDSSSKAIDLTRANVELNFPGDARHEAFAEDAFKFLDAMERRYDLIILDPPAFAKHKRRAQAGAEGLHTAECEGIFQKSSPGESCLPSAVRRWSAKTISAWRCSRLRHKAGAGCASFISSTNRPTILLISTIPRGNI